jgi:hypothetical protein
MNDIKTWQQGRYAPEGKHKLTSKERTRLDQDERHLVRPGVRQNAICHCPKPDDAAWISQRLNLASKLEQMTYDFAMGKTDGSEINDLVRDNLK